jgi:predicted ferric reductase
MPFLSNKVPYVGGRTIIEVILAAFASLVCITLSLENYEGVGGNTLDHLILITILLGMRMNPLNIAFGVSYERALMAHKFFGILILVIMGIHMQAGFNNSGIVLLVCLLILPLSYLAKRWNFELFYYAHIIAYLIIVPAAWLHGTMLSSIAVAFYALDLFIRFLIRGRKVSAEIEKLPGDVTMISFKKCFEYEAGQFVFIRIPSISMHEYHPFSICSSPLEDRVTLHVRNLGDWTSRLMTLAANTPNLQLDIYVEGPYGTTAVDITHEDYQVNLVSHSLQVYV